MIKANRETLDTKRDKEVSKERKVKSNREERHGRRLKSKEKDKRAVTHPAPGIQRGRLRPRSQMWLRACPHPGIPPEGAGPAGSEWGRMAQLPLLLRLSSGFSRSSFSKARSKGKMQICRSASKLALYSGGLDSSPGSPTF